MKILLVATQEVKAKVLDYISQIPSLSVECEPTLDKAMVNLRAYDAILLDSYLLTNGSPKTYSVLQSYTNIPIIALCHDDCCIEEAAYRITMLDISAHVVEQSIQHTIAHSLLSSELRLVIAKLDGIIAHNSEGVAFVSCDGTLSTWNVAMEHITGLHREHVVGLPIITVLKLLSYGPEYGTYVQTDIERAFKEMRCSDTFSSGNLTHRLLRPDGEVRYVRFSYFRLEDYNTSPSIGLIIHDVTSDILILRRVRESESRLQSVLAASHDSIIILDSVGKYVLANPSALKMLDTDITNLVGYYATNLANHIKSWGLEPGCILESVKLDVDATRHIWVDVQLTEFTMANDSYTMITIHDVTSSTEHKLSLQRAKECLEEAALVVARSI